MGVETQIFGESSVFTFEAIWLLYNLNTKIQLLDILVVHSALILFLKGSIKQCFSRTFIGNELTKSFEQLWNFIGFQNRKTNKQKKHNLLCLLFTLIRSIAFLVCGFCMKIVKTIAYNNIDKAALECWRNFCFTAHRFDTQVTAEASRS